MKSCGWWVITCSMTCPAFWRPSSISRLSFVIAWFLFTVSIAFLSFLRRLWAARLCGFTNKRADSTNTELLQQQGTPPLISNSRYSG